MTSLLFEGLEAYCLGNAYLGAAVDARVYNTMLPQGAVLPAVTFQDISGVDPAPTMQGQSGVERTRIQFTVWSKDPTTGSKIADVLKRIFNGFRGWMGQAVQVGAVLYQSSQNMGRLPGQNVYQRTVDFMFVHEVRG